jgi:tetratricopeptide (TPR) repeat protein
VNEAQTLFRDAVLEIRNNGDKEKARQMLMQSIKLNPQNEMAWLWLARTLEAPRQQMDCVERALRINPENEQALAMREEILAALLNQPPKKTQTTEIFRTPAPTQPTTPPAPESKPEIRRTTASQQPARTDGSREMGVVPPVVPISTEDKPRTTGRRAARLKTQTQELSISTKRRIEMILDKANTLAEEGDVEAAIEQWVRVLQIQVDHDEAMRNAVRHLSKLGYMDDAKELVWRALDAGTTHPSIYLTAIEIAEREGDKGKADELRDAVVQLPDANDNVVVNIADYYIRFKQTHRAIEILKESLDSHPNSQKILIRLGDLHKEMERDREAAMYYDRAAQLGTGTKEGKAADKEMKNYVPIMTDKQRGSLFMAWREAFGFGTAFLLLAFQDAGLNMLRLGVSRWAGVGLAVFGGYLLITATSSPQQRGLGKLLGGRVPEDSYDGEEHGGVIQEETTLPIIPAPVRVVLGVIGFATLAFAFTLVFSTALRLLMNPIEPSVPSFCRAINFVPLFIRDDELRQIVGCP